MPASLDYARRWGDDLLTALRSLEEAGVQHRDIKPANIGLTSGTEKGKKRLLLFDFSLSHRPADELAIGTPAYKDPDLPVRGRWDDAADRWAAAVTLHEMFTGVRPAPAPSADVAGPVAAWLDPERIDADVRDGLVTFFERAFSSRAEDRFATAEDMRDAFIRALHKVPEHEDKASAEPALTAAQLQGLPREAPVSRLPLSTRQRNALDRNQILTFGALRKVSHTLLSKLKGVGRETTRELLAFREAWRNAQSADATPPEATPAPDGPAIPTTVARVAGGLHPRAHEGGPREGVGRGRAGDVRARRRAPDGRCPARAGSWGEPAGGVHQRLHRPEPSGRNTPSSVRRSSAWWRRSPPSTASPCCSAVAEGTASLCGAPAAEALDAATLTQAAALVEIARATDDALHDAVIRDVRWVATDRALLDAARRLGVEADVLAARDVLPSADEASARLGLLVEKGDLARLGVERLLPLAARASARAACSARPELSPRRWSSSMRSGSARGCSPTAPTTRPACATSPPAATPRRSCSPSAPPSMRLQQVVAFRFDEAAQQYERAPAAAEALPRRPPTRPW